VRKAEQGAVENYSNCFFSQMDFQQLMTLLLYAEFLPLWAYTLYQGKGPWLLKDHQRAIKLLKVKKHFHQEHTGLAVEEVGLLRNLVIPSIL
jgi:hypothetical protein